MNEENKIGLLWDFDNVWHAFKYMPPGLFNRMMLTSDVVAITSLLPNLNDDQASYLALQSYRIYGNAFEGLYPLAAKAGFDTKEFHQEVFKRHYATIYQLMMEICPEYFDHARNWAEDLRSVRHGVKHGLLTHAAIDEWCVPIMSDIGILPFFERSAMVGRDQFDFLSKSRSTEPLKIGIERLGIPANRVWFAEDTLENLEMAAQVPGLTKVYIHHGQPLYQLPAYVDYQFETPSEYLRYLKEHVIGPPRPVDAINAPEFLNPKV